MPELFIGGGWAVASCKQCLPRGEKWGEASEWAMLAPAALCCRCFSTLSWVLVEKKTNDTWFYIHTVAAPTWNHAERVKKNAYLTPKQAPKNGATKKSNRRLLLSCGNSKAATLT